ncbi:MULTISPECIES: amidohydrolase family protein [unclassified Leifsonia]|uniref:amidohydrolase family protein n=1 Tax=unclassified Leifsonia TaxID=2663824 RepID=UPI000700E942|nr:MULTISPECIES: amidohydrolase family protein [unclassified Leifsonia]KQX07732.1 hypothetical protein ASC59_08365 [Leifsonia sp. Root1293]KRA12014.1 hypothetical protein ASD61_08365 [Leifsonia sp. Root60]
METTIVNARVFDGIDRPVWTSVRFADGIITECAASSAAIEGDVVIDAGGATLLPGLIDSHVHLVPGAQVHSLNAGVTTVADMFSTPDVLQAAMAQARSRVDVADVISSGIGATSPKGHPTAMYPPFPTVTSPEEADRFVDERIGEGSDFLKVFSGIDGRGPSLDAETITALVTAAHTRGLVVVAHVNTVRDVHQVVEAGVDVVAHVPVDADLDAGLIERMVAAGVAVGPTLVTRENLLRGPSGAASHRSGEVWFARARRNVRRLAEAGVVLLAGTDAPNPGTPFGTSLFRELELLVECGLSPTQALAAATSEPARVFRLSDRGRVDVGRRADLILVDGDPTSNLDAMRSITRIWRAGVPYTPRPFVPTPPEVQQLEAFDGRVAKAVAVIRNRRF